MTPHRPQDQRRDTSSSKPRDLVRLTAFRALTAVTGQGAYANIVGSQLITEAGLHGRDAALATELINGTCRSLGSYELIIEAAANRSVADLEPDVVDLLCLGAHQLLAMRVPDHAAISTTVNLARSEIGPRVTGLVNAILRKISQRSLPQWLAVLAEGRDQADAVAIMNQHPRWIVEAYAHRLGRPVDDPEIAAALQANNEPPEPTLVARPGLISVAELVEAGALEGGPSPLQASWRGNPGDLAPVRDGRAGVQDPGSQLVALALARIDAPRGPWLDLCAGPGGKAALLAALAMHEGLGLVAHEPAPHRARLVSQALHAVTSAARQKGTPAPLTVCGDGTAPSWQPGTFARVLADVPCSGLGALRRRPESRWRHQPNDVDELHDLQVALLHQAIDACQLHGVVGYATCSPHQVETADVVDQVIAARADVVVEDARALLPELADGAVPDGLNGGGQGHYVQMWPHRHGTDGMFLAVLRRTASTPMPEPLG